MSSEKRQFAFNESNYVHFRFRD